MKHRKFLAHAAAVTIDADDDGWGKSFNEDDIHAMTETIYTVLTQRGSIE